MAATIIYSLFVEREVQKTDMDMCPYNTWETFYENRFPTLDSAKKHANFWFKRQPINNAVSAVHAQVFEETLDEDGEHVLREVFNLFRNKTTNN